VLPFKVKGAFFVPFFYWILAILIIATVHESFHGIISRYYDIKVKSSGFAFLAILAPIIPAAFVEPDEKTLFKRPLKQQLAVFSAGAASNLILGAVFLLILMFVAAPISGAIYNTQVNVAELTEGAPAETSGLQLDEQILFVDNISINSSDSFIESLANKTPGDVVVIKTHDDEYKITLGKNPKNESKAYLGLSIMQNSVTKPEIAAKYGSFLPAAFLWFIGLLFFLYALNVGIGIFNLVPVGPIDGGRMLKLTLEKYFKKHGTKIFKVISTLFLVVIIINLLASFIK
jgi:membrane-associated protease RseP (regulator of RpoE activity)